MLKNIIVEPSSLVQVHIEISTPLYSIHYHELTSYRNILRLGLLVLALGYIGVGTLKYIYYVVRFRQRMEMSLMTLTFTIGHATGALGIWLMATACFLEWVPLSLDYVLLTDPIADYLPRRIRQGLIETYRLHLEDDTYLNEEEQHILEAIKIAREKKQKTPSITVRA